MEQTFTVTNITEPTNENILKFVGMCVVGILNDLKEGNLQEAKLNAYNGLTELMERLGIQLDEFVETCDILMSRAGMTASIVAGRNK